MYDFTLSEIVQRVTEGLRQPGMKEESVPLAEIFVIQVRKWKGRQKARN